MGQMNINLPDQKPNAVSISVHELRKLVGGYFVVGAMLSKLPNG